VALENAQGTVAEVEQQVVRLRYGINGGGAPTPLRETAVTSMRSASPNRCR
jgi:hypothetical protein